MSTSIMAACWPLKMPPTAKSVLISLADNANDQGYCWPSLTTIGERTCFSKRAVIDAIAWLEEAGALSADRSNGRHTTYVITPARYIEPVRETHQCGSRTGADAASTGAAPAPDRCSSRTQPVRQVHSNRQEPSLTVKKSNRQKAQAPAFEIALPDWLSAETWETWVKDRKERRQPLTQRAAELAIESLTKLRAEGWLPKVVIDNAIELGWRGLYAPKHQPNGGTHANRQGGSPGGVGDDVQRAIDERQAREHGARRCGDVIEGTYTAATAGQVLAEDGAHVR